MSCNADCKCRKGIVALVFVPGIMGTRLMNKKSGDSVWDPAAGGKFSGPSSTAMELKAEREAELAAAQADDDDGFFEGIGKWFNRKWIGIKEKGRGIVETGRKYRTKAAAWPRIKDLIFAGPVQRKALLVNGKTKKKGDPIIDRDDHLLVEDPGTDKYFRVYTSVPKSQMELKKRRGWGEVLWDSYGPLLRYLESKEPLFKRLYPGLQFPVFAVGYNWMRSNEYAGKRLKDKLEEFRTQLLKEDKEGDNLGLTKDDIKFVVISHSMGGYASRAGFILSGLESQVEAVIHGAMPTHGSPSTYFQFRCGAVGHGALGQVVKMVLGKNAADTTAILGFCQGGLELMPNKLYVDAANKGEWLFVNKDPAKQPDKRELLQIGYGSGIYDFYRRFDTWYSLVQPPLLAPELANPTDEQLEKHKNAFLNRITKCETFHDKLAANFHKTTTLLYSNNPDTKAFDTCEWQLQNGLTPGLETAAVERWQVIGDENHGWLSVKGEVKLLSSSELAEHERKLKSWMEQNRYGHQYAHTPPRAQSTSFRLGSETAKGDGTVHEGAGKYPKGVQTIGLVATQDHQGFFNCPDVRDLIVGVLQSWLPDIHQKFKG
ncbi:hypothetical protein [Shewanella algae]|uniref:hypothetical protein n=1 Tax=Shewanella algae TaxID=38313 RepID=UPI001AAEA154|nr:hypothetical protein [Shewanella algae]MBO2619894.1 hypothetical protein [Shewanella algae]